MINVPKIKCNSDSMMGTILLSVRWFHKEKTARSGRVVFLEVIYVIVMRTLPLRLSSQIRDQGLDC